MLAVTNAITSFIFIHYSQVCTQDDLNMGLLIRVQRCGMILQHCNYTQNVWCVLLCSHLCYRLTELMEKALRETQTLRAGCSKAEPKIFAPPQTPFPGPQDGQNLISWRWSLPSPTDQVWWKSMHTISSYRGNRHRSPARPSVRPPQTGPITIHCTIVLSTQCKYEHFAVNRFVGCLCAVRLLLENGADTNQKDSIGNTALHLGE